MRRNIPQQSLRDRRLASLKRELRLAEGEVEIMRVLIARTAAPTPQRIEALATAEEVVTAIRAQIDHVSTADAHELMMDMARNVLSLGRIFREEDRVAARRENSR